jgi:hypothetical protein
VPFPSTHDQEPKDQQLSNLPSYIVFYTQNVKLYK